MEQILDSDYWRNRLLSAREVHHAIFRCPLDRWLRIAKKHRTILEKHVDIDTTILDVGCGWGRILDLMPHEWRGSYVGVDVCVDFIEKAKREQPGKLFTCGSIVDFPILGHHMFDLAICTSFRPMVKRNLGNEVWSEYERAIKFHAKNVLYLEYDENDEGSLE